jgi:hypothetical protein
LALLSLAALSLSPLTLDASIDTSIDTSSCPLIATACLPGPTATCASLSSPTPWPRHAPSLDAVGCRAYSHLAPAKLQTCRFVLCFHAPAHDSALVHAVPCITRASVLTKLTHYHMFARLILNTDLSALGLVPSTSGLAPPVRLVSVSPVYSHLMQHHACTRLHSPFDSCTQLEFFSFLTK